MTRKKQFLDSKLCFDTWVECGSILKTRKRLRDIHGITNPNTGKLVTAQGVWESAWTYAISNLEYSRKRVEMIWRAKGHLLSDEDWYKLVIPKAKYIYSPKKFLDFMDVHSYMKPFESK